MKMRLHYRLKIELPDRLRHSVRNTRNTELPFAATRLLRYCCRSDRWGKIASRRHAVPDFVEIVREVLFKISDSLLVHTCCTLVRLYMLPCIPYDLLRNLKRLCLLQPVPPIIHG